MSLISESTTVPVPVNLLPETCVRVEAVLGTHSKRAPGVRMLGDASSLSTGHPVPKLSNDVQSVRPTVDILLWRTVVR